MIANKKPIPPTAIGGTGEKGNQVPHATPKPWMRPIDACKRLRMAMADVKSLISQGKIEQRPDGQVRRRDVEQVKGLTLSAN